jgi:hypothetical protein
MKIVKNNKGCPGCKLSKNVRVGRENWMRKYSGSKLYYREN